MTTHYASRLKRIAEQVPPPRCPGCGNWPTRIVQIDGTTNEMLSESMPETGCPACGRPPFRTIQIIGVDANQP